MEITNRNNYSLEEIYKISYLQGFISTFSLSESLKKSYSKLKKATNDVCIMISPGKFLLNQSRQWDNVPIALQENDNFQLINNIINLLLSFKEVLPRGATLSCFLFSHELIQIDLNQSSESLKEDILSKVTFQPMCNFKPTLSELFNKLCHKEVTYTDKKFLRIILFSKPCDKSIKANEIKKIMNAYTSSHLDFEGVTSNYIFCERDSDFINRTMQEGDFVSLTDSLNINDIEDQVRFLIEVYRKKERDFVKLDNKINAFATRVLQDSFASFAIEFDAQSQKIQGLHLAVEKDLLIVQNRETQEDRKEVIRAKMNDHVIRVSLIQNMSEALKDFVNSNMKEEIEELLAKISNECDSYRHQVANLNTSIDLDKMTCSYWTAKIEHLNEYLNEIDLTIQKIEKLPELIDVFEHKINENVNKIISSNAFANNF